MAAILLRRLEPVDWELYRTLRLAALADAPYAFGSTLAREQPFTDEQWRDRLSQRLVLVAEADGVGVGLVGLMVEAAEGEVSHADLVSMWVRPTARGTGAGDALVSAALREADEHGWTTVDLWVSDGNAPAERLYARHGFSRTGVVQPVRDQGDELEFAMRRPAHASS